jgi:hypothetical protein
MKLLKFNQFLHEGTEQTGLNEPTRLQYGTIDKLKSMLIGKTVKMTGHSTKLNPILKIENVEARSSKPGYENDPTIAKDVVYLDCSIVNEYGEEKGGFLDAGIAGNVDVTYNCNNNLMKLFKIGSEIIGGRNLIIGGETYVNQKLADDIGTHYGSKGKLVPTVKIDY